MNSPSPQPVDQDAEAYALDQAARTKAYYLKTREDTRIRYQVSEVAILLISAGVPISGALTPHDARLATVIGAVVVALSGLRAVFHWRDNWIRTAMTSAAVDQEIRLFHGHASPYDGADRAAVFLRKLNEIEGAEYAAWGQLDGPAGRAAKQ